MTLPCYLSPRYNKRMFLKDSESQYHKDNSPTHLLEKARKNILTSRSTKEIKTINETSIVNSILIAKH